MQGGSVRSRQGNLLPKAPLQERLLGVLTFTFKNAMETAKLHTGIRYQIICFYLCEDKLLKNGDSE